MDAPRHHGRCLSTYQFTAEQHLHVASFRESQALHHHTREFSHVLSVTEGRMIKSTDVRMTKRKAIKTGSVAQHSSPPEGKPM
jgi:hypothetical protein